MIFRTKIHRLTILLVFSFAASRAFLSDDDTDILKKARAWIAKHRQDYSLAFGTSDDPCEVLYDTAKRQLRWIRREYRLPYLIKKNYIRVLRKMKRINVETVENHITSIILLFSAQFYNLPICSTSHSSSLLIVNQ
ncbi:hypothetical protein T08_8829 [Trichinella sp. T8]|nr:hypothetical protein T08_8829 [Trichinella sp. T8]